MKLVIFVHHCDFSKMMHDIAVFCLHFTSFLVLRHQWHRFKTHLGRLWCFHLRYISSYTTWSWSKQLLESIYFTWREQECSSSFGRVHISIEGATWKILWNWRRATPNDETATIWEERHRIVSIRNDTKHVIESVRSRTVSCPYLSLFAGCCFQVKSSQCHSVVDDASCSDANAPQRASSSFPYTLPYVRFIVGGERIYNLPALKMYVSVWNAVTPTSHFPSSFGTRRLLEIPTINIHDRKQGDSI